MKGLKSTTGGLIVKTREACHRCGKKMDFGVKNVRNQFEL